MIKCEIICVGNELLLGDIVNTNSRFLTKALTELGVNVCYHTVVGDDFDNLLTALKNAFDRGVDVVITSGGLGPTEDDITKEACAKFFRKELVLDPRVVDSLVKMLGCEKECISSANLKQAYVPEKSTVFINEVGTAPTTVQNVDGKMIINLPGPPRELYYMFDKYIKPMFYNLTSNKYYSEFLRISGITEGNINNILSDLFLNQNPNLAPYVGEDELVLRLTSNSESEKEGKEMIESLKQEVYRRIPNYIYAEGNLPIEEMLLKELKKRGFKISFAESLTGGMVASRFVNAQGASSCFQQSYVTYSNDSKVKLLGVPPYIIDKYGVVSSQTAYEMVKGLYNKTSSEVCISLTGVAGPDKIKENSPGVVYIGYKILDNIYVKKYSFILDRNGVRKKAAFVALRHAYTLLSKL